MSKASGSKPSRLPIVREGLSWWPYALAGAVLVAVIVFAIASRAGPTAGTTTIGARGLPVGAAVPSMSLQSTDGADVSLDQLKGSKIVLYFYEGGG
ncbi:MAG: redoxin domain-containing protein [Candidatus Dormibacteraeota bacterium]|nr:redoxin domain-containing protein [Candidatus Dormibacteraeota bacterium]